MGAKLSNFYVYSNNQIYGNSIDPISYNWRNPTRYFVDFCIDKVVDTTNHYTTTLVGAGTVVQNSTESTGCQGAYKFATAANAADKTVLQIPVHVGTPTEFCIRSSHAMNSGSSWWLGWGIDVSVPGAQWTGSYFYWDGTDLFAKVGNGVATTSSTITAYKPAGSTMAYYSISRNATSVIFSIDGVVVATLANTNMYSATTSVFPTMGVLNLTGGGAKNLKVGGVWSYGV